MGIVRIQAIVRRSKDYAESTIQTGKLVVNLDTRVVTVSSRSTTAVVCLGPNVVSLQQVDHVPRQINHLFSASLGR